MIVLAERCRYLQCAQPQCRPARRRGRPLPIFHKGGREVKKNEKGFLGRREASCSGTEFSGNSKPEEDYFIVINHLDGHTATLLLYRAVRHEHKASVTDEGTVEVSVECVYRAPPFTTWYGWLGL